MCIRTVTGDEVNSTPIDLIVHQEVKEKQANKWKHLAKVRKEHVKSADERKHSSDSKKKEDNGILGPIAPEDVLFKITQKSGHLCSKLFSIFSTWKKTNTHRLSVSSAQLGHLIMILAVLCIASALVPTNGRKSAAGQRHSQIISLIYLMSFIIHFGSQIWMTFVSGLSLYFALPRHTFSEIQRILFPRYFTINSCLSFITLLIFVKHHPANTWDSELTIQVAGMTFCFFLELMIRIYLTPHLMRLIPLKNSIEQSANVGSEIGHHNIGSLAHCPHYLKIHKQFRRVHSLIALGNMCTMACTLLHLYYISSKLCVL